MNAAELLQELPDLPGAEDIPGYIFILIRIGAVIGIALLLQWIIRLSIRRFVRKLGVEGMDAARAIEQKRTQTIAGVLRTASTALIWGLAVLLILGQIPGIDLGPLLAAAGIGGVAIGFGAQSLVRDVISGFFILLEDQYHVGDIVELAGVSGLVEKITLRTTVVRDLNGQRHVIPNGEVTVSSNFTSGFSRYLFDLPVPYEEDVDRAIGIVRAVADDMRKEPDFAGVMLGPLTVLGVDDYADSQVSVKMYIETMPGKQWETGREFRRRIKLAYDDAGISIPYPHRQIIVRYEDDAIRQAGMGEKPPERKDQKR